MRGIPNYASICYEKNHNCPECSGKLGLREKKGNGQMFVCRTCSNEYWLEFLTGELTCKGKAKGSILHSRRQASNVLV